MISAPTQNASNGTNLRASTQTGQASYTIRSGDTLGALAQRFGTDISTLAQANGIANPNRIFVGDTIAIPQGSTRFHTVSRGDTLHVIARNAGLSVREVLEANPNIRNPDRIYPGDRIALHAGSITTETPNPQTTLSTRSVEPPTSVTSVSETSFNGDTLSLTQADINNIKRTLQTEWVPSAGEGQARGIIDTILNRTASGRWGDTVSEVVNARYQFSDINGPVSWRDGRTSVEQIPMAQVTGRVDRLVDSYLAQRANGQPSSIGSHLNYANPHYSDARNLSWINRLDGPVLGRGDAIHRHGTVPELNRHRPGEFSVGLPDSAPIGVPHNQPH